MITEWNFIELLYQETMIADDSIVSSRSPSRSQYRTTRKKHVAFGITGSTATPKKMPKAELEIIGKTSSKPSRGFLYVYIYIQF